ncbi:hypothetical protein GOBAR_AA23148 [Gossypium barbadense]|uniref:Uncharacterized protein n=1 Tax=Gossypium barbadense TaxID=3634 RepID=A0A2P5X2G9_GOSBA|nr:hypothetical protein GOBAR_AA23148 [Gossypium barbadense]
MVVSKGKDEVGHNEPKPEISSNNLHEPCSSNQGPIYEEKMLQIEELDEWRIQKLRTPDKLKPSQDELNTSPNQLKVGDKVLLDAADPRITTSERNEEISLMVLNIFPYGTVEVIHPKFGTFKPSLQETRSRSIHEPHSNNNKGPIYEEQRLQVDELDERRTPIKEKPKAHEKLKRHHNEYRDETKQIKFGYKVLLDENDPRIATLEHNTDRVTPFTAMNIFPHGIVEVTHTVFRTFKFSRSKSLTESLNTDGPNLHGQAHGRALGRARTTGGDTTVRYCYVKTEYTMSNPRGKKTIVPASKKRKGLASPSGPTNEGLFFEIIEPTYLELTLELCLTFHLQVIMTEFDDPGMVQFRLGGLVLQLSVPEFGVALGLYTKKFMDEDDFASLHRHIHYSPSNCWRALVPTSATYDHIRSKALALAPSLRYLHAYFLWRIEHGHVFDLAYFIALAIHHQTEQYRKGVISIGPYVTHLAQYFGLLNTAA